MALAGYKKYGFLNVKRVGEDDDINQYLTDILNSINNSEES